MARVSEEEKHRTVHDLFIHHKTVQNMWLNPNLKMFLHHLLYCMDVLSLRKQKTNILVSTVLWS